MNFFDIFRRYPSCMGFIAIIIWCFSALTGTLVANLPIFQMLSVVFAISACSILMKVWFFNEWYKLKQPILMTLAGFAAIYANDYFYFEAFKYAPAAHVDLINYLWPIFVIFFMRLFSQDKISIYAKFGCLVSFFGVYVLIAYDASIPFRQHFLRGYIFAILDAFIWALYVMLCRKYRALHSEMIGVYCFLGTLVSLFAHLSFETYVSPTSIQWISLVIVGVFAQGIAYVLWEIGIKKGNVLLLSNSAYFTPIGSVSVLILFSKASFTSTLVIATLLVTCGALLTNKAASV